MSIARKRVPKPDRPARRRRSAEEAKAETLAVARHILMTRGPDAVTLKNVASALGTTHTNLLHHFGTAGELQTALMSAMMRDLTKAIDEAVSRFKSDSGGATGLVEILFDAFDEGGAGRLLAWIALSNNLDHFGKAQDAVRELGKAIGEKYTKNGSDDHRQVTSAVIVLALLAFGESLIGPPVEEMMEREPRATRTIAAELLPRFF